MKKLSSPFVIIKKAADIFSKRENFIFLVKIYLPLAFFSLLSIAQTYLPSSIINSKSVFITAAVVFIQILYILTSVFVTISGIIALRKLAEGKELSVKKTFESARKIYWVFLLLSIVLFLAYLFGFTLLIIPGMLFVVWFVFSRFLMIEKGLGVKESLLKGREMVKGMYWKILGRLIIFGLFVIAIELVLSVIPYGIGEIINSLCGGLFLLPVYLLYKEVGTGN